MPASSDSPRLLTPYGPSPPANRFAAVRPRAQVQVAPVADRARHDRRRERRAQAVPEGDRADRLPREHAEVGRGDRFGGRDRQFELPAGVLGVELVDHHALPCHSVDDIPREVGQLDDPGHAVRRTLTGGDEVVAIAPADDPLDLVPHAELDPGLPGASNHAADERPLARGVLHAVLSEPVGGRPGPARLAGERDELSNVGK
jgi:hypothetical protein